MPKARDHVLAHVHGVGQARQVAPFSNRDRESVLLPTAQNLEHHHITDHMSVQVDLQLTAVVHRLAVERHHEITAAQPRQVCRTAGNHIGQHHTALARQPKTARENRVDRLRANTDIASPHPSEPPDLLVHGPDDVARRAETETLRAAGLRQDQRVDPDDSAMQIDQRPAAAARIERRVGLDVNHRRLGLELSRGGAHDTERHRVVEPERAAKCQHELTGAQMVGIPERQCGKIPFLDLEHREVRFEIDADDRGVNGAALRCENRVAGAGQPDVDAQPLRTGDHVRVRDDVAVRGDDHAGAGRALRGDEVCGASDRAVSGHVGGCEDLDHRRRRETGERFGRPA